MYPREGLAMARTAYPRTHKCIIQGGGTGWPARTGYCICVTSTRLNLHATREAMKYSRRRYARHATRSRTKRRLVSSAPIFPSFLPFSSSHHHHAGINFTRPAREDPTESILSIQLFHTSSDFRDKILCKVSAEYGILGFHRFSLSRNNDISSKRSKRSFWNLDDREIWTKWIFKKLRKERSSGIMFLHR